jgi:hypothetical protein
LIKLPLYITEFDLLPRFQSDVAAALLDIRDAMAHEALNPDLAVRQVREHLAPLFPPAHLDVLQALAPASWSGIHQVFVELTFRSKGQDGDLLMLGEALRVIYEHSTSPPRRLPAPRHIEVTYFFHMARLADPGYLGFDVSGWPPTSLMFVFCKYCWRQTVPLRRLCPTHAIGRAAVGEASSASARHKAGQRQLQTFEKTLNRMMTAEVMEFHQSQFQADVLFQSTELRAWLIKRRPFIWSKLSQFHPEADKELLNRLVGLLYDLAMVTAPTADTYTRSTNAIKAHPILAWPMLVRLEAFLQSRATAAKPRGGTRTGAGRKSYRNFDQDAQP